jgi:hypothetical protein
MLAELSRTSPTDIARVFVMRPRATTVRPAFSSDHVATATVGLVRNRLLT